MILRNVQPLLCLAFGICVAMNGSIAFAQGSGEKGSESKGSESKASQGTGTGLSLAGGKFEMVAPAGWESVKTKSSIVEAEFKVPVTEGDESGRDGRLTITPAGGSIEANINRWKGQFAQPDGGSTDDVTKVKQIEVNGMKAHMVDITGTFAERARMTAPPTMRKGYRMLAAIVETGERQYFVKLYGSEKTIEKNREKFDSFVKSFKKAGE